MLKLSGYEVEGKGDVHMQIERLEGGTVLQVKQGRIPMNIYADDPQIRAGTPGTLLGNVGLGAQINEVSKLQLGTPEAVLAKVIFRQIGQEMFLVIGVASKPGPDVYELRFDTTSKAPIIRGLKLLFKDSEITMRKDRWYEMPTKIVQDELVGFAVAGNWTQAKTRPRIKGDAEDQAANDDAEQGTQADGTKAETKEKAAAKGKSGKGAAVAEKAKVTAGAKTGAESAAPGDATGEKVPAEGL